MLETSLNALLVMKRTIMSRKKMHSLPPNDIATICDVYKDIQFDFDKSEIVTNFLSGLFGDGKNCFTSVTVDGEKKWGMIDRARLAKIVDGLMLNHAINSKWSSDRLLVKLIDILLESKASGIEDVKPKVDAFVKEIYEKLPVEYEICMPIYGVSIAKDSCIEVGKYSFLHIDYLTRKKFSRIVGVDFDPTKSEFWNAECFVCISICACEDVKAKELAMAQFKWIENAIRLFSYGMMHNAGITNYNAKWIERIIVARKGGEVAGLASSLRGPAVPLKIESVMQAKEFIRMISLLGDPSSSLTEMQKRIRHAIYLCGLSTQAVDLSVGFFLCVAALEALFCNKEDPYVCPSTSQQMLEAFCYLIVDEDKRRECFDAMRGLYRIRSAFAHGGEKELSGEDVLYVRLYVFAAISKLLTDENLSKMATLSDMQSLIKDIKFGKKK